MTSKVSSHTETLPDYEISHSQNKYEPLATKKQFILTNRTDSSDEFEYPTEVEAHIKHQLTRSKCIDLKEFRTYCMDLGMSNKKEYKPIRDHLLGDPAYIKIEILDLPESRHVLVPANTKGLKLKVPINDKWVQKNFKLEQGTEFEECNEIDAFYKNLFKKVTPEDVMVFIETINVIISMMPNKFLKADDLIYRAQSLDPKNQIHVRGVEAVKDLIFSNDTKNYFSDMVQGFFPNEKYDHLSLKRLDFSARKIFKDQAKFFVDTQKASIGRICRYLNLLRV